MTFNLPELPEFGRGVHFVEKVKDLKKKRKKKKKREREAGWVKKAAISL